MTEQELINKIKELKNIQPSKEWLGSAREKLIYQIKPSQVDFLPRLGLFNWLKPLQPIALTISLILIFIAGPWLTLKASQNSLPGETLYSVKKAAEKIQAGMASEESQVGLQVDFAQRRLEEINKLNEDSLSPEEKNEKVEQAAVDFKNNLAGANQYVKKVPKEKAKAVAQKTKKIRESLTKTKEEASLVVQEKLAEAENLIKEIDYQILATLVEDEKDNQETASTTDKEVLIFLEEKTGFETTTDEIIE